MRKACSILITGANRGLGLEMVKQLVETPCPAQTIFACCRDPSGPKAKDLQEQAKKHPGRVQVIRLDVSNVSSIKAAAQQVSSVVGTKGLNVLVNNAGVLDNGTMQSTGKKEMQEAFDINVMGPMLVTQEFLPLLRQAAKCSGKPGMSCCKAAVVNISTTLASLTTIAEMYAFFPALSYRIAKAGLNMLTVCNALEFKKDGILFVALHPGWVRTELGGSTADIDASESVRGQLNVMDSLTEKQTGAFLSYKGEPMAW